MNTGIFPIVHGRMPPITNGHCPFHGRPCHAATQFAQQDGDIFFAYASEPEGRADAIRGAIASIQAGDLGAIGAADWGQLPIEGGIIWCQICGAIRSARCVVADITDLNFNVLFELGYAIGANKPVWPLVEDGSTSDHLYASFRTLTTLGYSHYRNHHTIVKKLKSKSPWLRTARFHVPELDPGNSPPDDMSAIVYLKSPSEDEASLRIGEALGLVPGRLIIDDPAEISFQPLSWYTDQLAQSWAVMIDLGSGRHSSSRLHTAKCALVGGIALASGRRLLMVGGDLSTAPIDYHDLVRSYKNAAQASAFTRSFVAEVTEVLRNGKGNLVSTIHAPSKQERNILRRVNMGESIAEQERGTLEQYFVETPQYLDLAQGGFRILVGRKGAGKTAIAQQLQANLTRDPLNIVCHIRPKSYELDQLCDFIQGRIQGYSRGYYLESLWKYMLYSEVIVAITDWLAMTPLTPDSPIISALMAYRQRNDDLLRLSFPSRLRGVLDSSLRSGRAANRIPEENFSERFHLAYLREMRDLIRPFLASNIHQFALIIDGLDSNWKSAADTDLMCQILLALIEGARDTWVDWTPKGRNLNTVNLTFAILLRSDIFRTLLERASEPDKLQYERVFWEDGDLLLGVIERRIASSVLTQENESIRWEEILEPGLSKDEVRSLVERNLLYRPRDVILYFKRALFHALQRDQMTLSRRDFETAMREYSEYVFQALAAELQPFIPDMTELLLGFAESKASLDYSSISGVCIEAGIKDQDVDKVIKYLIEANFLGVYVDENNFAFALTPAQEQIMERQASRFVHGRGGPRKFRIHKAFHEALGILTTG